MIWTGIAFLLVMAAVIIGWAISGWIMFWFAERVRRGEPKPNNEWWPWDDE
jgi:hypothetical protein